MHFLRIFNSSLADNRVIKIKLKFVLYSASKDCNVYSEKNVTSDRLFKVFYFVTTWFNNIFNIFLTMVYLR